MTAQMNAAASWVGGKKMRSYWRKIAYSIAKPREEMGYRTAAAAAAAAEGE